MHEKEKIDLAAHLSKDVVDLLPIDRDMKELGKRSIDVWAEVLKLCIDAQTAAVQRIQVAAHLYGLERVVVFPYPINGRNELFFRMYGGSIPEFCLYLGISLLPENPVNMNPILVELMEKQHGVVLYDRYNR